MEYKVAKNIIRKLANITKICLKTIKNLTIFPYAFKKINNEMYVIFFFNKNN